MIYEFFKLKNGHRVERWYSHSGIKIEKNGEVQFNIRKMDHSRKHNYMSKTYPNLAAAKKDWEFDDDIKIDYGF